VYELSPSICKLVLILVLPLELQLAGPIRSAITFFDKILSVHTSLLDTAAVHCSQSYPSVCPLATENYTYSSPFTSLQTISMLARAARPKLALAVPISTTSHALKSPLPISPSPISPTVRNTRANQRGFSTFQQPTFAYALSSNTKSILKKSQQSTSSGKKLQFREEPAVRCITPVPDDYHGTYVKMSRDDRRWGKGVRE